MYITSTDSGAECFTSEPSYMCSIAPERYGPQNMLILFRCQKLRPTQHVRTFCGKHIGGEIQQYSESPMKKKTKSPHHFLIVIMYYLCYGQIISHQLKGVRQNHKFCSRFIQKKSLLAPACLKSYMETSFYFFEN